MDLFNIITFISTGLFLLWVFFKVKFRYWKNLGVPHHEPRIPFGNMQGFYERIHLAIFLKKMYDDFKHKGLFCGMYLFTKPACMVTDLDFLKLVLVKDFSYFHDRGVYYNLKDDPLSGHLVNLEGEKWKKLREKLTPTFTSGKMRYMFPTIIDVAKKFESYMTTAIIEENEHEIKGILARFTTNIIGSCAFGIECNTFEDPNSKFLEMGLKALDRSTFDEILNSVAITFPNMARKFGFKIIRDDVSKFFTNMVKEVVEYRGQNNIKRNDFMDLLLQMKNEGNLTFEETAAQVFVFFIAGFETSSTTMTFALHELSLNQDVQDKARANILEVLEKHKGEITYEALSEMTYLERCINESLRKFPPVTSTIRKVTKDYHIPDSDIILPKGLSVLVPIYGIHHDPEIYPEPEKFDPNRFLPENTANRHPMAFLPFGQGNRICIGQRFGYIQAKVGLATLLSKFKFEPSPKTKTPIKFALQNRVLTSDGGMFLKITKL